MIIDLLFYVMIQLDTFEKSKQPWYQESYKFF